MDTIFALASARGKAGVAVVRVSGPDAHAAVAVLCALPEERKASLRRLVWRSEVLDQALVVVFGAGRSFTGEPVVELHLHGSAATTAVVLRALSTLGLRLALPGEFTRRAMNNGQIDLAQVEGLADLIDAETEVQRRQAMRVLSGALGRKADAIKASLLHASALIAAMIDFSDEDLPGHLMEEVRENLRVAKAELETEMRGVRVAERIRDGFEVAIVGAPNVGKSSILNALVGREAAITSTFAGTTRDVIEVRMDIDGLAVTLLDTAGLRETSDPIEAIGVTKARGRAEAADLRLVLVDSEGPAVFEPIAEDLLVWTKSDLNAPPPGCIGVSSLTGEGLDELVAQIGYVLSRRLAGSATATRERHRAAIERALGALESASDELEHGAERLELAADDLRSAMLALDSLVGRIGVEDLLDKIFASFCVGK